MNAPSTAPSTGDRRRRSTFRRFGWLAVAALTASALFATPGVALGHTLDVELTCDRGLKVWLTSFQLKAGDPTPNVVAISIDGDPVVGSPFSFGERFVREWPVPPPPTSSHTAVVAITAWNDPTGSNGWTKTFNLSLPACETPPDVPLFQKVIVGGSATFNEFTFQIRQGDVVTTVPGSELDANGFYSAPALEAPYTITETGKPSSYVTTYRVGDLVKTTNCSFVAVEVTAEQFENELCVITNTYSPPPSPPSPTVPPTTPPTTPPTISTPIPTPTAEPTPPTGEVAAATATPRVTPPPTDTTPTGGTPGGGSLAVVFLAIAALLATIRFLTPATPAKARRRR